MGHVLNRQRKKSEHPITVARATPGGVRGFPVRRAGSRVRSVMDDVAPSVIVADHRPPSPDRDDRQRAEASSRTAAEAAVSD